MNVCYGFTSSPEIPSPERGSCQPRPRQTRRSTYPPLVPSLGPSHHIPAQLSFCTRVRRSMPSRIPLHHHRVNKQIGAITTVPEAALAYSHGDPLPTRLHPVNNRGDTTHKSRQRCPALNHTRCLLLTGSARHADRSVSR